MASEQSEQIIRELLDKHDEVIFDHALDEIKHRCDVKDSTAQAYIRTSQYAVTQMGTDGTKVLVSPEDAGETMAQGDDEVIQQEVGSPVGQTFGELDILKDEGHPEIKRHHEEGYVRRRMSQDQKSALHRKTDVQVVTSSMADDDFSTLLIGKHGVGKDKLVLHICANTNRPSIRLVGNDDPDFVDLLVGTYAPNADGGFEFKKGLLTIAIENGYTFILDEFNTLSGKVQSMLNKILEGADQSQLVIPETNQVIEPHDQFIFVATQNPNEVGYGGREDLNMATGSRFFPIKIPPLQEEGEKKVVAQETHWEQNDRDLDKLIGRNGVVTGIRALHTDMGKISTWMSTRDVIQVGRMANRLGSTQAAAEIVLVGRADPEDEQPIRDAINDQNW